MHCYLSDGLVSTELALFLKYLFCERGHTCDDLVHFAAKIEVPKNTDKIKLLLFESIINPKWGLIN